MNCSLFTENILVNLFLLKTISRGIHAVFIPAQLAKYSYFLADFSLKIMFL